MRIAVLVILALVAVGCVQRTIKIDSKPQGALVYLNDVEVGRTPTTVPFTFYGTYDVRLVKDGYQTLHTAQQAKAPLHDTIGVDLLTEMAPWRTEVELDWMFHLDPMPPVDEALTVDRARQLRAMVNAPVEEQVAEAAAEDGEVAPADAGDEGVAEELPEREPAPAPLADDEPEPVIEPKQTPGDDAPDDETGE